MTKFSGKSNFLVKRLLPLVILALPLVLVTLACGEEQQAVEEEAPEAAAPAGGAISDACDVTEPAVVTGVFGGTATEEPGIARNCIYNIQGGSVQQVNVYYYGTAAEWDGIRAGYEENRGPLKEVLGVGDKAFNPGDVGQSEIVVLSGDTAFAVGLGLGTPSFEATNSLRELARRIARDLA